MTLQAVVLRRRSTTRLVVLAVAAVTLATVVRWTLGYLFEGRLPWSTYSLAVLALAMTGGKRAGLCTALLAAAAGTAMALAVPGGFRRPEAPDLRSTAVFLGMAVVIAMIGDAVRAAFHELEARRAELETELARRRRLEGELRDADRRKNEFLAMLAHELRNPLAPIRNAVHVLRRVGPTDPTTVRARDMIDRQAVHMARLIDDLLQVSRITRDLIELRRAPVALADVVHDAVDTVRPLIDERGHALSVDLGRERFVVDGDRARLVQAVSNVVMNAAKFTPPGGRITVTARPLEVGRAALVVEDTGVGVPAEMHERVFELFAQEDAGTSRSQGGLGIGLTLCKRLVEMHGGRVTLASGGRNHGTRVTIELPVVASTPVRADERPAPADAADRPLRVLVVEDIPDTRESFVLMIELDGHDVRAAGTGAEALHAVDAFTPDVAFVDLGLPDMDGFALARRLHADARTAATVLVAVSGYGSDEDKAEARRAGFAQHLTKPTDVGAIRTVLAERAAALRRAAAGDAMSAGPLRVHRRGC